jgi:hypothetical protein
MPTDMRTTSLRRDGARRDTGSRALRSRCAVTLLAAALLGACGGRADDPRATGGTAETTPSGIATTGARSSGGTPKPCLTDAAVSGPVGFAVTLLRTTAQSTPTAALCTYQPVDDSIGSGVEITIAVGPASAADQVVRDFANAARARSGRDAEHLAVGDRGLAFGSNLSSGALAVKGDRVAAISISSPITNIGDKKAAAIEILKAVIA